MPKPFSAETLSDRRVPIVGSTKGYGGIAQRLRQSAVCLHRNHRRHKRRVPEIAHFARCLESSNCRTQRPRAAIRRMGRRARFRSENNFIVSLVPYQTLIPPGTRQTGVTTMTKLHILGVPALVLVMLAPDAMAQRRGGGAVSGGVRGAMVGGLVGGSEGAETGAKVGAVAGATRAAVDREAQRRADYQTSAEYQNAPHSDFNTAPPQVLVTSPPGCDCASGRGDSARRRGRHSQGW